MTNISGHEITLVELLVKLRVKMSYLRSDLVSALPGLDVDDFPHIN